jgi:hypothetical protein
VRRRRHERVDAPEGREHHEISSEGQDLPRHPLGLEVGHYLRHLKNEFGATESTLRDYEAILAKLALDHADLELVAFEPT